MVAIDGRRVVGVFLAELGRSGDEDFVVLDVLGDLLAVEVGKDNKEQQRQ